MGLVYEIAVEIIAEIWAFVWPDKEKGRKRREK